MKLKNPHRQVILQSEPKLNEICYLPDSNKLKIGNYVTLKDYHEPNRLWKIIGVSRIVRDKSEIKRTWHNNI